MKTILFPSDFSENANNALDYAVELCQLMKAKLVLFHAYELPYSTNTMSTTLLSLMKQEANKQLNKCVASISSKAPGVEIETILRQGNAVRSISEVASHVSADLIVMGTKGASGVKEVFVGSNTASVIYRSQLPVLVVPEEAKYRTIDKVVYASDFLEKNESNALSRLKEFVQQIAAEILVLHVALPDEDESLTAKVLEKNLADVKHSFYVETKGNIEEGIREFVDEKGADILVMMARKHSMLDLLFNPVRLTKRMTYQPDLPLLILHEE